MRQKFLEQRHEHEVSKDPAILSVIDNEDQLLGKKSRVNCVAEMTRTTDRIINFQMPVVVPGNCGNAITSIQAQSAERVGEFPGPFHRLTHGVSVPWIVHRDRYDFAIAMKFFGMLCDR